MSQADFLRERATKMRTLAAGATPGRWRGAHDSVPDHPCTCGLVWEETGNVSVACTASDEENYVPEDQVSGNTHLIAASSPVVTVENAELLECLADFVACCEGGSAMTMMRRLGDAYQRSRGIIQALQESPVAVGTEATQKFFRDMQEL